MPTQADYAKDFELKKYKGKIYKFDEISGSMQYVYLPRLTEAYLAAIATIEKENLRGTLLAIGPMWNLTAVLQRHAEIAPKLDLVAQVSYIMTFVVT